MTHEHFFEKLVQQYLPPAWADASQQVLLASYLRLLQKWNAAYNLTAIDEPLRMVTHHLIDSLSICYAVTAERVLDLGCGAGLPGIPLAIVRPKQQFVLLDSIGKKIRFCRYAISQLGLPNIDTVQARAREWQPSSRFAMIVARAFGPAHQIIAVASHLLTDDGVILAMKGKLSQQELEQIPQGWQAIPCRLETPGLAETRHLLSISKVR